MQDGPSNPNYQITTTNQLNLHIFSTHKPFPNRTHTTCNTY